MAGGFTFGEGDHMEYEPLNGFEYGIEHRRYPVERDCPPHRWGLTEDEAKGFVTDWENNGGVIGVFRVIRRPVGKWAALEDYDG